MPCPSELAPERALGVGAVSLSRIHSESAFGPSLSSRLPSVSLRVAGGLGEGRMKREVYMLNLGEGDGSCLTL